MRELTGWEHGQAVGWPAFLLNGVGSIGDRSCIWRAVSEVALDMNANLNPVKPFGAKSFMLGRWPPAASTRVRCGGK